MAVDAFAKGQHATRRSQPRAVDVTLALVRADLRDSHDLRLAGVFKWLLEPLASMGMYIVLVDLMLARAQPDYPLFLLSALLPWRFVQGSITGGLGLVRSHGAVLSHRRIPRIVLPLVLIAREGASFLVGLTMLVPLMIGYRVAPTFALLWIPLLIAILVLLLSGPVYLAAVFGLYFPDYRPVVAGMVRLGFLGSSGIVALHRIQDETVEELVELNPASSVFDAFRDVVIAGRSPTLGDLVYPSIIGAVLLLIGLAVYERRQPSFAKEV